MNKYTVLVLRPAYIADDYGQDTCQVWVFAPDVPSAELAAQRRVAEMDRLPDDTSEDVESCALGYAVLTVHHDHLEDLKGTS